MAQRKRLGEILVQAGVLNDSQLRAALSEQRRWGGPLGRTLVDMKLIAEDTMVQALSQQLNMPSVNLDQRQIPTAVLDLIPGELAEQLSVIPFSVQGKFLDLAMSDPTNIAAIDAMRTKTRMNVRPYLAGPRAIERALSRFYGRGVAPIEISGEAANAVAMTGETVLDETPSMGLPQPSVAAARRAIQFGLSDAAAREAESARLIAELRERVERLEALLERDEDVLRKLLTFLVQKGIATREEIRERLK